MLQLRVLKDTHIKRFPSESYKELPAADVRRMPAGTILRVKDLLTYERSHLKLLSSDDTIWWAYVRDVEVLSEAAKQVGATVVAKASNLISRLDGIYRSQRDNRTAWWAACNATSFAMAFLRHGLKERSGVQLEDEFYEWMLAKGLNPESHADLQWACGEFTRLDGTCPLKSTFVINATRAQIRAHIDADKEVILAGYTTGSGHIFMGVGYTERGLICMDPWGKCLGIDNYQKTGGDRVEYSWALLDKAVIRDGDCYCHFIDKA